MQPHVQAAATALQESREALSAAHLEGNTGLRVPYKALRGPSSNLRVNKWDALILDSEILGLLKTPMKSMFSMFEPGVVDRIKPEIDAILGAMLFAFTTGVGRPTPGMKLENVRYAARVLSRRRVAAFFLLSVVVPYVWKRMARYLSSAGWSARASAANGVMNTADNLRARTLAVMKKLETLVVTCQFANLLVFLRNGTYRSLPERVLGMKIETIAPSTAPRSINFEYMTRQLLWDGLMEFGNFVLPFLTWGSLRASSSFQELADDGTRSSQCCLCGISPPQTPYITSCKHVYCYYCLQTAVATENDFACVACGVRFDSSQRLRA